MDANKKKDLQKAIRVCACVRVHVCVCVHAVCLHIVTCDLGVVRVIATHVQWYHCTAVV